MLDAIVGRDGTVAVAEDRANPACPSGGSAGLSRGRAVLLGGLVWLVALAVLIPVAASYEGPSYFDAAYYVHVAANLASGRGLVEDVIWTYLTDPSGLPQPSNLYWMPLTSIVAAPFLALGGGDFRAAQAPLLAVAALVPAGTALIAVRILGSVFLALAAAALTLFSGYYFAYWAAVDSFGLFTLAAGAAMLVTAEAIRHPGSAGRQVGLGLAIGAGVAVAHLARADGPLLLVAAVLLLLPAGRRAVLPAVAAVAAYLALLAPWLVRNLLVAGTPLPAGALRTAFLVDYADLFAYGPPPDPAGYLAQGLAAIVESKLGAAVQNLAVLFGLEYWLVALAAIGWWSLRREPTLRPPLVYGVALYAAMTLVFTAPSTHGSMLHSGVALVPWLAIAAVRGVERSVARIADYLPHWNPPVATRNFTLMFVAFSVAVSLVLARGLVAGLALQGRDYADLAADLAADRADAVPLVLNPPAWWYVARRPAIVTPSNGPEAALAAAARYGATHLILEPVVTPAWRAFRQAGPADPRFELIGERGGYRLYRLTWADGR